MPWYQSLPVAVRFLIFAFVAVFTWRVDGWWLNHVLRSGIVLYFAANVMSFADSMTVARWAGMPPNRVLRVKFAAIAAASLLAGVGALITWSPVGYLAAGCFFFLSLTYWWVAGKLRS
jgi:hypothetical protein